MKVKDIVAQIEHTHGRKSHKYMMALINDGLDEITQTAKGNTKIASIQVAEGQRWYDLLVSEMIDVFRVEVLDDKLKWRSIPRSTMKPEIGDDA